MNHFLTVREAQRLSGASKRDILVAIAERKLPARSIVVFNRQPFCTGRRTLHVLRRDLLGWMKLSRKGKANGR